MPQRRKWCFVPKCANTSTKTPSKLFITVPKDLKRRRKWFDAARRSFSDVSEKTVTFCCEDHFNLEEDMENFIEYKLSNNKVRVRMKSNVVPHIFACQTDRQSHLKRKRSTSERRAKKKIIDEILEKEQSSKKTEDETNDNLLILPSTSSLMNDIITTSSENEQSAKKTEDKTTDNYSILPSTSSLMNEFTTTRSVASQTSIIHFRSRGIQVSLIEEKNDATTSPIKFELPEKKIKQLNRRISESQNRKSKIFSQITDSESSYVPSSSENSTLSSDDDISTKNFENKQLKTLFIKKIEQRLRSYTGIPKIYLHIIDILAKHSGLKKDTVYLILYKIRTDDTFLKIADLFGMSNKSSASRTFSLGVKRLAEYMKTLIFWPSSSSIFLNLPIAFRVVFSQVQSIIDCFEIEIQKPSSALQQSLTWSDYKKCNTVKYLISSTPDGFINFISHGYGGRVSDASLFEDSGFLNVLPNNCVIMADRGFKQIEGLLNKKKCTLIRPPSVTNNQKMTKDEVNLTKRIASVRIHIERIIKRVRDFKMLSPHATVHIDLIKKIDEIVVIACAIINLQHPIINH